MKSAAFGNFQIGMVDDPSVEDQGGFEFASGMDIFSEPGVLKACNAMEEVTYGTGATPTDVPRWMVDTADAGGDTRAYLAAGNKILESTDGITWNLFLTNAEGANLGLGIWAGYVVYPSPTKIGRAPVGNAAAKNDAYITGMDSDTEFHPVMPQGGTLKIGAGRYVASLDESFAFTARAMKLPDGYRIRTLAEHLTNLFMGTRYGAATGAVTTSDSSVFAWRGTVLASGSALPDVPYAMKFRGMNALLSDGRTLWAFPDRRGDILAFDGVGFPLFRKIFPLSLGGSLAVQPGAVTQYRDTKLIAGDGSYVPGIYQMKDTAICQSYLPVGATPGGTGSYNVACVKVAFNGMVFMGYYRGGTGTYHIAREGSNKQNGAVIRTLWHRIKTDKLKRWQGIKLNLKNLPSGCSVAVAFRTDPGSGFSTQGTVTASNQGKPVLFSVRPRTTRIQFQFTLTTSGSSTPELLSYDPIFDILNASR